jgi:hypothetical protein
MNSDAASALPPASALAASGGVTVLPSSLILGEHSTFIRRLDFITNEAVSMLRLCGDCARAVTTSHRTLRLAFLHRVSALYRLI